MKHTKKLIPAIGMLLLSACMLVTSTFAWFSMNTEVSATGMKVSAVGDQVFLQIGAEDETFTSTTQSYTTVVGDSVTDSLMPSALVQEINAKAQDATYNTITPYATGAKYTWVTNNSNGIDSAAAAGDYVDVSDKENYFLLNTFAIRLDEKAGQTKANGELRVSGVTLTLPEGKTNDDLGKCVSVFVVGETGYTQLWKQDASGTWSEEKAADNGKLTADLFNYTSTPLKVKVYVFFDGENSLCKISNYKTAVNDYTVAVSFTVAKKA